MISNLTEEKKSLNLFSGGKLSTSDSLLLDQLEPSVRDIYNEFTDELISCLLYTSDAADE